MRRADLRLVDPVGDRPVGAVNHHTVARPLVEFPPDPHAAARLRAADAAIIALLGPVKAVAVSCSEATAVRRALLLMAAPEDPALVAAALTAWFEVVASHE